MNSISATFQQRESLDRHLEGIDAGAARAVLEGMRSFPAQDGRVLYDLIVSHRFKRGVEIGTAQGNSTIWMGMAFKKTGGKLITIEISAERAKVARKNFRKAGLEGVIEGRNADAFDEIPRLVGSFDFVFMDTGAAIHKKLLDLLKGRLVPAAAVTSHNADTLERYDPDFWNAIHSGPAFQTSITSTASGGISVSIRR